MKIEYFQAGGATMKLKAPAGSGAKTGWTALMALIMGLILNAPFASASPAGVAAGLDAGSVDGLIRALYESISFSEGRSPDWALFRSLFASASSPCVRLSSDGVRVMDRESFIAFFGERIAQGTMKSFAEREVARTTESYGGLVQVFSTYEKRMNLADPGKPVRGINGFQLFFKDGRWWIASLVWQDELPALPIPPEYSK